MKVTVDKLSKRLHVLPETAGDIEMLVSKMEAKKKPADISYSIEDTLFHRIMFNVSLTDRFDELEYPIKILPATDGSELREYQKKDIARMCKQMFTLNRNEMGLGKTIEAIAYARAMCMSNVLIICPKPVQIQWRREIQKWWPECYKDVKIYEKKDKQLSNITITNYEKLRATRRKKGSKGPLETSTNLEKFKSVSWDLIICDEAHRLRNRESLSFIGITSLPAKRRLGLTGTPILNRPNDLYALFKWLHPWYAGKSYWTFVRYFCRVEKSFFGDKIVGLTEDPYFQDVLIKMLDYISVYNLREEVLKEVPPKLAPQHIPLEMDAPQKKLYNQIKKLIIDELQEMGIDVANGMSKIIKLRQVTSNPGLLLEDLGDKIHNPKFSFIRELLEDNPKTNIVVFSWFAETIKSLNIALEEWGFSTESIYGEVAQAKRDEALQRFKSGNARVMTGTIGALGTGVDGLQYASSTVVFLERDWNPMPNEQAEDRLCRYGQDNVVKVYVLDCINTVDEYVGRVNLSKAEDMEIVLRHGKVRGVESE